MRSTRFFKRPSRLYYVLASLALLLFHHTFDYAQAQIYSGPVSSSMGGGGRAGAEAGELVFLNPATAALSKGFEANFFYRDGYWADGEHENAVAVTMIEHNPENFSPGGVAYVQRRRTVPGLAWQEKYYAGFLAQSVSPYFTFGLMGYKVDQAIDTAEKYTQWNGSIGILVTLSPQLGISYVLANLLKADETIPEALMMIPQQSIGVSYLIPKMIRVTFDLTKWDKLNPDSKGILAFGTEVQLTEFALLRAGYQLDDIAKRNFLTLGGGFNGPRMKINYALVKPIRGTDGAMHSVDILVPF
jgi:hypothetical protein